ncbi:hypothetical protein M0811_07232 [Anaeramoeba ignava]|uniref:Uncharacterized protein n=1 Tax=Anaeramoeba ignava TaxID=1746090 RepID=A0A9Q0LMK9_ANAIG|nr:hypothetical protein M0811_07232 [Anaeramoeba ignava]
MNQIPELLDELNEIEKIANNFYSKLDKTIQENISSREIEETKKKLLQTIISFEKKIIEAKLDNVWKGGDTIEDQNRSLSEIEKDDKKFLEKIGINSEAAKKELGSRKMSHSAQKKNYPKISNF